MSDLVHLSRTMSTDVDDQDILFEVDNFPKSSILDVVTINGKKFARVYWDFLEDTYPDKVIMHVYSKVSKDDRRHSVVVVAICTDEERSSVMLKLVKNGYPVTFGRTSSTFVGGM